MIKLEKTCTCIAAWDTEVGKDKLSFLERHEYQVDVYMSLESSKYRVYANGGWTDYIDIDQKEFDEHFRLIE